MKRRNGMWCIWDDDSGVAPANMPDLEDVAFEDRVSSDTMDEDVFDYEDMMHGGWL